MLPSALASRDFRLFSGGHALSALGSQFTTVALAWEMYLLTNSALDIGLIGLARAVPQMSLLLVGGLLADAIDRRRLLILVQIGQLLVTAGLTAISAAGGATPAALFVASALLGLFAALETPGRQAIVPSLVAPGRLTSALALTNAVRNVGALAGPALAGLLLAVAAPAWCYAVDSLSWLVMLPALAAVRPIGQAAGGRRGLSIGALRQALRFVITNPVLLTVMALDFGATLFGAPAALFPIYAKDILQVGPTGLGILHASVAAGAILGGLVMSTLRGARRAGLGVLLGVAIYGLATALFALSPTLWIAALCLAVSGIGNAISAVLRWTISQVVTPDHLRGRVSAVNSIFTQGGPQLGQLESGIVAEAWGAQVSALSGGIACLILVALVAAVPGIRSFRLGTPAGDDLSSNRGPRTPDTRSDSRQSAVVEGSGSPSHAGRARG